MPSESNLVVDNGVAEGVLNNLAQEDISIDSAVIAGVLSRIYRGRYGKSGDKGIDRPLFEATHEVFNLATASGIAEAVNRGVPAPSAQFLELLDRNNAIFSAFRTHKMQKDVASLLLDNKGKIKKFADFKRDVTSVIGKYNGAWLRTEYATAVQRSRLATKWQQFVDEADVFAARKLNGLVARRADAAVGVFFHADALVLRGILGQNGGRCVRRAVVDQNDLHITEGLAENTVDTRAKIMFSVVYRHNDAHAWFGHIWRFLPINMVDACASSQL